MGDDIDSLLASFARELDYFGVVRDRLQPVMEELLAALQRFDRDTTDGVALIEIQHLRRAYAEGLSEVRPALEEWALLGNAAERLRDATDAMSRAQESRFHSLLRRDTSVGPGRATFAQTQAELHAMLERFDGLPA